MEVTKDKIEEIKSSTIKSLEKDIAASIDPLEIRRPEEKNERGNKNIQPEMQEASPNNKLEGSTNSGRKRKHVARIKTRANRQKGTNKEEEHKVLDETEKEHQKETEKIKEDEKEVEEKKKDNKDTVMSKRPHEGDQLPTHRRKSKRLAVKPSSEHKFGNLGVSMPIYHISDAEDKKKWQKKQKAKEPQTEDSKLEKIKKELKEITKAEEQREKTIYTKLFTNRMTPSKLIGMVNRFDEGQREATKSLGLGFILDLKIESIPGNFADWLVRKFDYESSCWWFRNNQSLSLEPEDVHLTLGLPIGGSEIIEAPRGKACKDPDYVEVLNEWLQEWGIKDGNPKMAEMPDFIVSRPGNTISFQRNLVLYAVASLFDGATNVYCPRTFLKNIQNVDMIRSLDWCKYVCHRVTESVKAYKGGATTFTGPIVFMMLFYFDRMQYEGKTLTRRFPTLIGWAEDEMKKRIEKEERGNGFGRGKVIARINHPITRDMVIDRKERDEHKNEKDVNALSELQRDIEGFVRCAKKVTHDINNYESYNAYMRKKYKDTNSPITAEVVDRILDATTSMLDSYTQQKKTQSEKASSLDKPMEDNPLDDVTWIRDEVIQTIDKIVEDELKKINEEKEKMKANDKDYKDMLVENDEP